MIDFWLIAASCGSALAALLLVTWALLKGSAREDRDVVAVGQDAAHPRPDITPLVVDQDGNTLIGVRRGPQ